MFDKKDLISRRNFLQKSFLSMGSLVLLPSLGNKRLLFDEWPQGEMLGRNVVYSPNQLPLRNKPNIDSNIIRNLKDDEVLPWINEVVGSGSLYSPSKRWVETPEGFIYAPSLQKVKNLPNTPISNLPEANGEKGMWVEVTIPYVNLELMNQSPLAPWLNAVPSTRWRLYYSQVIWVDEIQTDSDGRVLYRLNERYGSYGDIFWADATAFRVITQEEIAPINPQAPDKKILVNINQQSLICYEGNNEVYFCSVATGRKLDELGMPVDTLATPVGTYWIWRKLISLHMSGGGSGAGYDTMAIPWTSLFVGEGVAIHATFWHNDFGTPKSHGCVNALPEDAKWIFRWTTPQVFYNPGDITNNTYQGTKIEVIEPLY